jgi:carbon-monoxide dehydrogenase small subunit
MELIVNGEARNCAADPRTPLLDVLRDEWRLTGAKPVCREGFCGACMVQIDGQAVPSCLLAVGQLEGRQITTIEGLSGGEAALNAVQQAFLDHDVVQCGMCFPGMVMSLSAFVAQTPSPTRDGVKAAMTGNICRCTGYERIVDAILSIGPGKGAVTA